MTVRSLLGLAATAVALITTSLSGPSAGATTEQAANPSASPRSSLLQPLPSLAKRCSVPGLRATTFRFKAADGVLLDGAVLGQGPVGIVFAHEAVGDLCSWVLSRLPDGLSQEGFRVLVFDYRGFGLSAKVTGKRATRIDADILGAIAELRRRGSEQIVLVGASLGGSAVLTAAASARPPVAGVVSISGPDSAYLRGGGFFYATLDPTAAASRVRSALLFFASKGDRYVPAKWTGNLYKAAAVEDKRLVVVPGSSHGVSIVSGASGAKWRSLILEFIRDHTGS